MVTRTHVGFLACLVVCVISISYLMVTSQLGPRYHLYHLYQDIAGLSLWHFKFRYTKLELATPDTIEQCILSKEILNRDEGHFSSSRHHTEIRMEVGNSTSNMKMPDGRIPPIYTPRKEVGTSGRQAKFETYSTVSIALGCGITTRDVVLKPNQSMKDIIPFFMHLLTSFCTTASPGFSYIFYVAYDFDDQLLAIAEHRVTFMEVFRQMTCSAECANIHVGLKFVRCNHRGKPARAQNDAMMAAYADNVTYLYMTNDDTVMGTSGWTETFIGALEKMSPPNVGVVGPNHLGGNRKILTYHFLHRTHIDIFHYFYPPNFTDWHADSWVTHVYAPDHSEKITSVLLKHTLEAGTRYIAHVRSNEALQSIHLSTRQTLRHYLELRGYALNDGAQSVTSQYHLELGLILLLYNTYIFLESVVHVPSL